MGIVPDIFNTDITSIGKVKIDIYSSEEEPKNNNGEQNGSEEEKKDAK